MLCNIMEGRPNVTSAESSYHIIIHGSTFELLSVFVVSTLTMPSEQTCTKPLGFSFVSKTANNSIIVK